MAVKKDEAGNMIATVPEPQSTTGQPNVFTRLWTTLMRFLREVRIELKKTNWPSRNDLTKAVVVVMATIIVSAVVLWVLDNVAQALMTRLLDLPTNR